MDQDAFHDSARASELAHVPDLRARFGAALARAGVDGDEAQEWALTFTELVNNSVEHGCVRPGDVVSVRWWVSATAVRVRVNDPGACSLTNADFENATCDGFADSGRGAGLFLIRALVDDVAVRSGPDGGTEIEVQRLRGARARRTEL